MPDTTLQQQNQLNQAKAAVEHITPQSVTPNAGSTIPNVYTQDLKPQAAAQYSGVTPPSVSEIHRGMWEGSFMVALMAGLATGNAGAAITAGLWGSIAIHDHGYTLRQRAEYVPQLQKDGYSPLAIQDWFTTGKNDELDKERQFKEQAQRDADNLAQRKQDSKDRKEEFNERQEQSDRHFNQQMGMQEQRFNQMAAQQDRMYNLQKQRLSLVNSNSLAHLNPLMNTLARPHTKELRTLADKQNYLDQLATDIKLQEQGNPAGYNALLTAVAGVDNPNISPREGAIERIGTIGGLGEQAKNYLQMKGTGTLTPEALQQFKDFAAAHQTDTNMQRQRIHNQVYGAALPLTGNPQQAAAVADAVSAGGVVPEDAPVIATAQQQTAAAEPPTTAPTQESVQNNVQNQASYPHAPQIGTVQDGYKYTGGDPSKQESWSKQ